jgi:chromosomal replication initiation ATPase DnaA
MKQEIAQRQRAELSERIMALRESAKAERVTERQKSFMASKPEEITQAFKIIEIHTPKRVDREKDDVLSVREVQDAVCAVFEVRRSAMISPLRDPRVAIPRHVAYFLCGELTGLSWPVIGRQFGGRDHTSALRGARKIRNDPARFQEKIRLIKDRLFMGTPRLRAHRNEQLGAAR